MKIVYTDKFKLKAGLSVGVGTNVLPVALHDFKKRVKADDGAMIDFKSAASAYRVAPDASLTVTPSAIKAAKIYAVLPDGGAGDMVVARASASVQINEGVLETVAEDVPVIDTVAGVKSIAVLEQAANLITRFLDFSNAYWTKTGAVIEGDASTAGSELLPVLDFNNWTGTASIVDATTISASANVQFKEKSGLTSLNKLYRLRISGNVTNGNVRVQDIALGGNYTVTDLTGNFNRDVYFNAVGTRFGLVFNSVVGTATLNITNFQLEEVQGFADPAGGLNAYKLVATADAATIQLKTAATVVDTTVYSNLICIKRVTGTGVVSLIDVNNGDVVKTITSEWTIISDRKAATSTDGQLGIKLATSGDEVMIYNANLTTTDIDRPITVLTAGDGTNITRQPDNISKTGIAALIGQTEGTVLFKGSFDDLPELAFVDGMKITRSAGGLRGLIIGINQIGQLAVSQRNTAGTLTTLIKTDYLLGTKISIVLKYDFIGADPNTTKVNGMKCYIQGTATPFIFDALVPDTGHGFVRTSLQGAIFGLNTDTRQVDKSVNEYIFSKTQFTDEQMIAYTT